MEFRSRPLTAYRVSFNPPVSLDILASFSLYLHTPVSTFLLVALTTFVFLYLCSSFFILSLFLSSGQYYKQFTLVNYDSRAVPDLKTPHITTLGS